jgi:hypothetical protein
MSAGILHNDGRLIYNQMFGALSAVDRGTNLVLRLFTAVTGTRDNTTTLVAFTEPTGGGYAPIQVPPSALLITGTQIVTNVAQTYTANSSGYSGGSILGYFWTTSGATPRLVASELFNAGPFNMVAFATLTITPAINLSL